MCRIGGYQDFHGIGVANLVFGLGCMIFPDHSKHPLARLIDWLIDCLIAWFFDRSIDWLIDWLIDWVTEFFSICSRLRFRQHLQNFRPRNRDIRLSDSSRHNHRWTALPGRGHFAHDNRPSNRGKSHHSPADANYPHFLNLEHPDVPRGVCPQSTRRQWCIGRAVFTRRHRWQRHGHGSGGERHHWRESR